MTYLLDVGSLSESFFQFKKSFAAAGRLIQSGPSSLVTQLASFAFNPNRQRHHECSVGYRQGITVSHVASNLSSLDDR